MATFTTRPEIIGTFGVAASTHWLAAQTAMGVLERGGNAFDAAVAAGFVLQVAEPHLNGPGGEVPILLWSSAQKKMESICGQGSAPAAATPEYLRKLGLDLMPGIGLLPAAVPGAFGAWMQMLREHGTWSVADVLAPAIGYARDGIPLVPRAVQAIIAVQPLFEREWKTSAALWLPGGNVPRPGALFCNPVMAATYARVINQAESVGGSRSAQIDAAVKCWYQGFVAREIDRFFRTQQIRDTSGARNTGLLRYDDLAAWQPSVEAPVTIEFGRYKIGRASCRERV